MQRNGEAMTPAPFRYWDFTLATAIGALSAYDHGATDSGISDPDMRAAVVKYLNSLGDDERRIALAEVAEGLVSEEGRKEGYGIADVVALAEWLESQGIDL